MPVKLADTREMTLDYAVEIHRRLAQVEIELAVKEAHTERRIAKIKAEHQKAVAGLEAERQSLIQELTAYILMHPEQFEKPRAIRTDFGRFGRRKVSNVAIIDQDRVVQWALDNGYTDAVKTVHRIVKPALAKRIRAGESVPGAALREGEEAFYAVDKSLIDAAKKGV